MSNDTKSKKQSQDYFDIEEYLEERLAELEAYGDYQYEEELEDRHNEPPIDSYTKEYFFEELFNEYTTPSKAAPATSPILNKDKNLSRYNKLMKQYVSELSRLTYNMKPSTYQIISGAGPAWFYEPLTKRYIKTERGSEVVIIPGEPDDQGRLLVRTMGTFLLIPCEEVLDLGYN